MNVEELLSSKQIEYTPKGADFIVKCLNPEHEDRNPSMRVDQISGVFQCFSCGYKGNLFNLFGENFSALEMKRGILKKKLHEKRASSLGLSMPSGYTPYVGTWRDIKQETYQYFEAFQHTDKDFIGRIVFPIRDRTGKIVAFNGRHLSGETPKYKISPPGAKLPLFPNVAPIKSSIILVEGIYDVINLHDKGLRNAVCCFGTNNINEEKLSILKMSGVLRIDIFFDGDEAGQKAVEKVKMLCEKVDLNSRNIVLKDTDPGELSESAVKKLRTKLYG